MAKITGRIAEKAAFKEYSESNNPEFVVVYGRRRVGKTFLIRETFNNRFDFYATGLANTGLQMQLRNFNTSLQKYGSIPYPQVTTWFDSFEQLKHLLEHSTNKKKKILFLDELPWMDTRRSDFITALEHFWNGWASSRPDILLIVCGSATSWMVNKLIKNYGGLHNRVTRRMLIEPFTLGECEAYYKDKGIVMSRYQMIEAYMIFGGIPYYLSLMNKGMSLAQNADMMCFAKNGAMADEFPNLYNSLFRYSESYIKIVEALGKKNKGLTREEIVSVAKLPNGGGLTKMLEELEQCGFIRKYNSFGRKQRSSLYQLVDFYTLFYLNFIRGNSRIDEHYWSNMIETGKHRAWSGYAFEQVCLTHINQIKHKLGISGILTKAASWQSAERTQGAQVDLLIDRNDQVINLCEMKFSNTQFIIDKKYDENLRNKKDIFIRETKTRKAIHITMATTYGIKQNEYSGGIQSEIKMDDLFSLQ